MVVVWASAVGSRFGFIESKSRWYATDGAAIYESCDTINDATATEQ